ncbi:MAG: hypothetical protein GFGODING_00404 [Flavobacteriales bacterium]|nr:hypothetical protein [Flavobacteriales bacterium]
MNTAVPLLQEPPARYTPAAPSDAAITDRIHMLRGRKVMLDRDLAALYGVETKHLKRQVRRNMTRFPEDFMFEVTEKENEALRSHFGTLKQGEHAKYLPMAFTEQGVAMLSSVLNSEQAILVNIHIIRVFNRMREALLQQQDILARLEALRQRADGHDVDIAAILRALRQLTERPAPARKAIGFKPGRA